MVYKSVLLRQMARQVMAPFALMVAILAEFGERSDFGVKALDQLISAGLRLLHLNPKVVQYVSLPE